MKVSSASGRSTARSPKGPAKIIPMPAPKRLRRRRAVRVASIGVALSVFGAIVTRVNTFRGFHPVSHGDGGMRSPMGVQEFQILKLVNDERARAGALPLQFSPRLMTAARMHSSDMAARGYLGHDGPDGDTPADRARTAGIGYAELGENVYADSSADLAGLPARTVEGWLASPAHRANLLSPRFQASAVGIGRSASGKIYITEDFIR